MTDGARVLIPEGTVFSPEELVHYADPDRRTLDDAVAEADLLVALPHAGAAIPAELDRYLASAFTRRLQYDFTDVATSAIVRRWAELDPRIVAVENPHPRLVRDPNRPRPADLAADLREAIRRVREAGPYQRVDLTGVDAIRPVTFSFFPMLVVPERAEEVDELVAAFEAVGEQGLAVYERTRDALRERFAAAAMERGARGEASAFTFLSFHDTMNRTTTREGAVDVEREPKDRLPDVVALSNRGDARGEPRGTEGDAAIVTMDPARLRALAEAHRIGFAVSDPAHVALNQPYLGSREIVDAGAAFAARLAAAGPDAAGVALDAVQAEFRREFLLGEANAHILSQPGTGWIEPDPAHVDRLARQCMAAWAAYRNR
ncbi:MAG: N-formylglutamate amidohydrolase [Microbacteriaceae bacterium]|nr:N-formylglutamate amidohydrolase [Microbacteriaceae bacterium]